MLSGTTNKKTFVKYKFAKTFSSSFKLKTNFELKQLTEKMKHTIVSSPSKSLVYTNFVYVSSISPSQQIENVSYVQIADCVYISKPDQSIKENTIGLSSMQRSNLQISLNDTVEVESLGSACSIPDLSKCKFRLELNTKSNATLSQAVCETLVIDKYANQIFTCDQYFAVDIMGVSCKLTVCSFDCDFKQISERGKLTTQTKIEIFPDAKLMKQLHWERKDQNKFSDIIQPSWNFADMGIGGLDEQFNTIFRRAFASRMFSQKTIKEMGIKHIRGLLLWGPAGTGKTLIARQIGKMLTAKEPKIVNGPEILNKFVGASEQNIRELFIDAEIDQKNKQDQSDLHIIIFDEIDSICKARGSISNGTSVGDTVVNQLLTKIDGINSLNNILIIGMTNRKDLIDPALLRPGRLEVQLEIGLPDKSGRSQILNIHTKQMYKTNRISPDVNLDILAENTKNFSGAEIEALVKSAASYALYSSINITNDQNELNKLQEQTLKSNIVVQTNHFDLALKEIKPAFGVDAKELESFLTGELYDYGKKFKQVCSTIRKFFDNVQNKEHLKFDSVLLCGPSSSGKTSIAVSLALQSTFNFVKIISSRQFLGYSDQKKMNEIINVFENAYKSSSALVIIDSIEHLIEFVDVGPRFSSSIVQCLITLCSTPSQNKHHRLMILATTSHIHTLNTLGLKQIFTCVEVPLITHPNEVYSLLKQLNVQTDDLELHQMASACSFPIGIKKLLPAIQNMPDDNSTVDTFVESLQERGLMQQHTKTSIDVEKLHT